uniref:Lipoprotein n=1 Tax=Globodera pallida TaxID=36090 RepID=A0A183BT73_GLOPA
MQKPVDQAQTPSNRLMQNPVDQAQTPSNRLMQNPVDQRHWEGCGSFRPTPFLWALLVLRNCGTITICLIKMTSPYNSSQTSSNRLRQKPVDQAQTPSNRLMQNPVDQAQTPSNRLMQNPSLGVGSARGMLGEFGNPHNSRALAWNPWYTRVLNAATKHGSGYAQAAGTAMFLYSVTELGLKLTRANDLLNSFIAGPVAGGLYAGFRHGLRAGGVGALAGLGLDETAVEGVVDSADPKSLNTQLSNVVLYRRRQKGLRPLHLPSFFVKGKYIRFVHFENYATALHLLKQSLRKKLSVSMFVLLFKHIFQFFRRFFSSFAMSLLILLALCPFCATLNEIALNRCELKLVADYEFFRVIGNGNYANAARYLVSAGIVVGSRNFCLKI